MKYRQRIFITILLILITEQSHCMVYMWKDTAGVTHYTNKDYEIPPRFSSRVKLLYPEAAEKPVGLADNTKEPVISEAPLKQPTPVLATQPITDKVQSLPRKRVKRQGRAASDEE